LRPWNVSSKAAERKTFKAMNLEILTITLPEEKPPIVDVKQRFEVGGIVLQARLTLINNVLPESAVQQEPLLSTEEAALRDCLVSMEQRIVATVAARKPEARTEKLLTPDQAAEYIGVHVETLRKWARSGKIPRMSLPGKGNRLRFSEPQLDKWIADRSLKGKNLP
jgi:excisionase family DNA binding protein